MTAQGIGHLSDLRGHRTAPPLTAEQRHQLREELLQRLAVCDWCTIGVMAPGGPEAWAALRSVEQALGWSPPLETSQEVEALTGRGVFLKGHQRTGQVILREEAGLGEGVLITGHSEANPDVEDTWGPLPLDFFLPAAPSALGGGAAGL